MNEFLFLLHVLWVAGLAFVCREQSLTVQTLLMVMYAVLGNLMVLKQMVLFGLVVTTSDVYAVGVILVLNYIREAYDDHSVYLAMIYSFSALFMLALAAYFQISYIPATMDPMTVAYTQLMTPFPKIVMVSAIVYIVVQYLDNLLFSYLKYICSDRYFVPRVALSLLFSQILDTVLFSFGALSDIAVSIWDIIIFSATVKITCSIFVIAQTSISHWVLDLFTVINNRSRAVKDHSRS